MNFVAANLTRAEARAAAAEAGQAQSTEGEGSDCGPPAVRLVRAQRRLDLSRLSGVGECLGGRAVSCDESTASCALCETDCALRPPPPSSMPCSSTGRTRSPHVPTRRLSAHNLDTLPPLSAPLQASATTSSASRPPPTAAWLSSPPCLAGRRSRSGRWSPATARRPAAACCTLTACTLHEGCDLPGWQAGWLPAAGTAACSCRLAGLPTTLACRPPPPSVGARSPRLAAHAPHTTNIDIEFHILWFWTLPLRSLT